VRRLSMVRVVAALSVVLGALVLAGCGGGGSKDSSSSKDTAAADKTPVTLTFWSPFSARELKVMNEGLAKFHQKYPWITVKSVGAITADKLTAAIHAGNPPDVASMFETDNLGAFCNSGAWQDLNRYIDADKFDMNQFPKTIRDYTAYKDKRCALPFLADTYGLYYNKKLLAKAGISEPPKTVDELAADAKKLTTRNKDGSLDVVGFDPLMGFYENAPVHNGPMWGAKWMDGDKSALAEDPAWEDFARWTKKLGDSYGYDKLVKWQAGAGDEFSASNAFERGKLAMMLDGEYRIGFIKAEHPELDFGTAPLPVSKPDLHGSGFVIGTIMGLPKGAKHTDPAWLFLKFFSTDETTLAQMSNGLQNIPSTLASLKSTSLKYDPRFKTFMNVFANPKSSTQPVLSIGAQNQTLFASFLEKWQAGHVKDEDLHEGIANVDKQINAALEQAGSNVP
jgi:multiple sugar transport system substrate-binding protein